jgi:hypothetical protein
MSRCSRVNRSHWCRRRNVAAHSGIVTVTAVPAPDGDPTFSRPPTSSVTPGHRQHTVAAHLVAAQRILEGIKPTQSCARMIWLVAARVELSAAAQAALAVDEMRNLCGHGRPVNVGGRALGIREVSYVQGQHPLALKERTQQ